MKINFISATVLSSLILFSCSEKKEEKKSDGKTEENVEEVKEEITYEAFDSARLEGNWKVIDAQAYSKDKMMGQTYSFIGDTATFLKTTGDVEMAKAYYEIEGDALNIIYKKRDEVNGGNVKLTFSFKGGFFENGNKLQMNANDAMITLEKQ
jgi:hypothetical protein